jgi:hypothetical protein
MITALLELNEIVVPDTVRLPLIVTASSLPPPMVMVLTPEPVHMLIAWVPPLVPRFRVVVAAFAPILRTADVLASTLSTVIAAGISIDNRTPLERNDPLKFTSPTTSSANVFALDLPIARLLTYRFDPSPCRFAMMVARLKKAILFIDDVEDL